ncbi:MAG TPA: molybdenum cofactor biosynthesis protein MoaE [Candidatus Limnocylindria bacterium]|nr:molybdenum cofactor biosynthesis protein MoaE [Candidatus Limnocylindria bacterium]
MNVRARLFASAREAAGVGHLLLELPAGATVRDAIAAVTRLHPLVGEIRQMVIAKNREYVGLEDPLADGDELALIPPVSGGSIAGAERILVSASPLSLDAAIDAVRGPDTGGIVVFLGTVRDASRGKRVRHLEYEAYAEMAEAKMREIASALERAHAPLRLALHHRVGDLAIGDTAVIVVAAAPHREAAFIAARSAIDELKRVVPIWKKEYTDDGAVWIEDHA